MYGKPVSVQVSNSPSQPQDAVSSINAIHPTAFKEVSGVTFVPHPSTIGNTNKLPRSIQTLSAFLHNAFLKTSRDHYRPLAFTSAGLALHRYRFMIHLFRTACLSSTLALSFGTTSESKSVNVFAHNIANWRKWGYSERMVSASAFPRGIASASGYLQSETTQDIPSLSSLRSGLYAIQDSSSAVSSNNSSSQTSNSTGSFRDLLLTLPTKVGRDYLIWREQEGANFVSQMSARLINSMQTNSSIQSPKAIFALDSATSSPQKQSLQTAQVPTQRISLSFSLASLVSPHSATTHPHNRSETPTNTAVTGLSPSSEQKQESLQSSLSSAKQMSIQTSSLASENYSGFIPSIMHPFFGAHSSHAEPSIVNPSTKSDDAFEDSSSSIRSVPLFRSVAFPVSAFAGIYSSVTAQKGNSDKPVILSQTVSPLPVEPIPASDVHLTPTTQPDTSTTINDQEQKQTEMDRKSNQPHLPSLISLIEAAIVRMDIPQSTVFTPSSSSSSSDEFKTLPQTAFVFSDASHSIASSSSNSFDSSLPGKFSLVDNHVHPLVPVSFANPILLGNGTPSFNLFSRLIEDPSLESFIPLRRANSLRLGCPLMGISEPITLCMTSKRDDSIFGFCFNPHSPYQAVVACPGRGLLELDLVDCVLHTTAGLTEQSKSKSTQSIASTSTFLSPTSTLRSSSHQRTNSNNNSTKQGASLAKLNTSPPRIVNIKVSNFTESALEFLTCPPLSVSAIRYFFNSSSSPVTITPNTKTSKRTPSILPTKIEFDFPTPVIQELVAVIMKHRTHNNRPHSALSYFLQLFPPSPDMTPEEYIAKTHVIPAAGALGTLSSGNKEPNTTTFSREPQRLISPSSPFNRAASSPTQSQSQSPTSGFSDASANAVFISSLTPSIDGIESNIVLPTASTRYTNPDLVNSTGFEERIGAIFESYVRMPLSGTIQINRGIEHTRSLAAHPFLPYFVSAHTGGTMLLWRFGEEYALAHATVSPDPLFDSASHPRGFTSSASLNDTQNWIPTRVRFEQSYGSLFGVSDNTGGFSLFQLDGTPTRTASLPRHPIIRIAKAHAHTCNDFSFIGNGGYLVATTGDEIPTPGRDLRYFERNSQRSVLSGLYSGVSQSGIASFVPNSTGVCCVYDLLLPPHSMCVSSITIPRQKVDLTSGKQNGGTSIIGSTSKRQLIMGHSSGTLLCVDLRNPLGSEAWSIPRAHNSPITALAMDPWEQMLVSGSADGEIKIWDTETHALLATLSDALSDKKHNSVNPLVTDLTLTSHHLFSSGASGRFTIRQLFF